MKMKNEIWTMLLVFPCLAMLLSTCNKDDGEKGTQPPTDNPQPKKGETIVVGEYEWSEGKRGKLLDITSYYNSICYVYPLSGKAVKHIAFENLPQGMKETVRDWGIAFPTRVFRTQWKGETVYHLLSALQDEDYGVYHESGENCRLYLDPEQYVAFIEEQKGTECVLILKGEIIKDSSGAKNELVGLWCHDWQHLTYSTINDHGTDVVQLYPNLPFSMTEVCQFEENGKGRLMTEKTYNDGRKEVCVDHFKYEVTDYTSPNSYEYRCYFEAGDTIDYLARSRDGFKTFNRASYFVNYPWRAISSYDYDEKSVGGAKYGTPQPDANNRIVGRWEGGSMDYMLATGGSCSTWVFRSDLTGYLMLDGLFQYSFVYTVNESKNEAQVTIYKYDIGFTTEEGFCNNPEEIAYDSTILPKGVTMKAKFTDNLLELEGWEWSDANYVFHSIVFHRK